jgi:ABC-type amino acid transport system permease subunit
MLEIIFAWTPQLLKGALATIGFSIVSFFLGLIIGILSNIFYFSKNSFLSNPTDNNFSIRLAIEFPSSSGISFKINKNN